MDDINMRNDPIVKPNLPYPFDYNGMTVIKTSYDTCDRYASVSTSKEHADFCICVTPQYYDNHTNSNEDCRRSDLERIEDTVKRIIREMEPDIEDIISYVRYVSTNVELGYSQAATKERSMVLTYLKDLILRLEAFGI